MRNINVTAPNPGLLFDVVSNQRERLWVVNNDTIVIEMSKNRKVLAGFNVNFFFHIAQVDRIALECIMEFFGYGK
ncbi:MAG: hypothetical protein BWX60_00426 [Candidatus Marinimicrobia bacterium ADurb.Bin030]|nr:MAG: hypothetical protein BWX60_00426 [Candidatus Marinimicrobia bacterium ADurb.Bin030]